MKHRIINEETVYNDFFKIKEATIVHDTFDGKEVSVVRKCFERGDSVAVFLFEKDTNSILLTNQFRYPTIKEGNGWINEITAGSLEKGDKPDDRVKMEVEEEIGYRIQKLEFISSFFVSPGGTSERILLYYSEILSSDKVHQGGGLISEKEDIQLIKVGLQDIIDQYENNQIRDAKSIIAIQWFLMNKLTVAGN